MQPSGGGGRSPVWNQIKAHVLGVPYQPLEGSEFATWGSAMVAGKAAGIFSDLAAVAQERAVPNGSPFQPSPEVSAVYQPLVEKYIRWQALLQDGFRVIG